MSWADDAACRGHGELFFNEHGGTWPHAARLLCTSCPVAAECAEAGVGEPYGMWGGLTPQERSTGGRRPRAVQLRACPDCGCVVASRARGGMVRCGACREDIRRAAWRAAKERARTIPRQVAS